MYKGLAPQLLTLLDIYFYMSRLNVFSYELISIYIMLKLKKKDAPIDNWASRYLWEDLNTTRVTHKEKLQKKVYFFNGH